MLGTLLRWRPSFPRIEALPHTVRGMIVWYHPCPGTCTRPTTWGTYFIVSTRRPGPVSSVGMAEVDEDKEGGTSFAWGCGRNSVVPGKEGKMGQRRDRGDGRMGWWGDGPAPPFLPAPKKSRVQGYLWWISGKSDQAPCQNMGSAIDAVTSEPHPRASGQM